MRRSARARSSTACDRRQAATSSESRAGHTRPRTFCLYLSQHYRRISCADALEVGEEGRGGRHGYSVSWNINRCTDLESENAYACVRVSGGRDAGLPRGKEREGQAKARKDIIPNSCSAIN